MVVEGVSVMGPFSDRPVCEPVQRETAPILLPGGKSHAVAHNALMMNWDGLEVYAFTPQPLIQRVLLKVKRSKTRMILIAPNWGRRPWMSMLLELLTDIPRILPVNF